MRISDKLGDGKVELRDGYAYFIAGNTSYRTPLTANSTPQALYSFPGAEARCPQFALGSDFVAFASVEGVSYGSLDGTQQLTTLANGIACGNAYPQPFAASGDSVYFSLRTDALEWSDIKRIDVHQPAAVIATGIHLQEIDKIVEVRPPYAYVIKEGVQWTHLTRFNLEDSSQVNIAGQAVPLAPRAWARRPCAAIGSSSPN